MNLTIGQSVVVITSDDPGNATFGTGFIVDRHGDGDYVVTCAHVIRDVGGPERVQVDSFRPAMVTDGTSSSVDLAVLNVKGLAGGGALALNRGSHEGMTCQVIGFRQFGKHLVLKDITGTLGRDVDLTSRGSPTRMKAWDLNITEDQLQPGYSGAPVVDSTTGNVIGVASHLHGGGTKGLVIDLNNLATVWPEVRKLKWLTADSAKNDTSQSAAVRFNIEPWSRLAWGQGSLLEDLLNEKVPEGHDKPYHIIDRFLNLLFHEGHSVEVFIGPDKLLEKIDNSADFWVRVLSTLAIHFPGPGHVKRLIQETIRSLRAPTAGKPEMTKRVWTYICQRYCKPGEKYYRSELLELFCRTGIDLAGSRRDALYNFFSFLYKCLEHDPASLRKVAYQLAEYDDRLGKDVLPPFLVTLKKLIGEMLSAGTHSVEDIPEFKPNLASIPAGKLCPYDFSAMVYPLTVLDCSSIQGVLPRNIDANAMLPYVFRVVAEDDKSLFNRLASEVLSLVTLCNQFEVDLYAWDVPTVCEWLALADCESAPYPWHTNELTRDHANLGWDGAASKLRPVGTCRLGVSGHGTMDCCGNVHEIVRISRNNEFPSDFRLAGGCYQTKPAQASCRIIREFKTRQQDNRRNVGLRLIRFNKTNCEKRWQALEPFWSRLQPRATHARAL